MQNDDVLTNHNNGIKRKNSILAIRDDKHYKWKGDSVKYSALHQWVMTRLGKPSECENCGSTTASRYHWANLSGNYLRDIADWARLCSLCHILFDDIGRTAQRTKQSKPEVATLIEAARRKNDLWKSGAYKEKYRFYVQQTKDGEVVGTYPNIRQAALANHINPSSLSATVRGKHLTLGGYTWELIEKDHVDPDAPRQTPEHIRKRIAAVVKTRYGKEYIPKAKPSLT